MSTSVGTKLVFDFAEGSREMRDILGGKGANVAEMTRVLGAERVPAGFTITTEACVAYMKEGDELEMVIVSDFLSSPDGSAPDGAVSDGPPPVGVPPDCVVDADPKEALPCLHNDFALFVSASGSDANPGTKESPLKTIATALDRRGNKPRIYICEGTYPEHVLGGAATMPEA